MKHLKFKLPNGKILKVMEIVDNYVIARYTGCRPFLLYYKDFNKKFSRHGLCVSEKQQLTAKI